MRERSWERGEHRLAAGDPSAQGTPARGRARGPRRARPPAPAATTGAGTSYHVGHGPYAPAPPRLPWALEGRACGPVVRATAGTHRRLAQAPAAEPNAKRPTGTARVPGRAQARSAFAAGLRHHHQRRRGRRRPGKDYLAFSANVWNAGPAPLVVDGFRSPGKDLMDAYQYFYDADGQAGRLHPDRHHGVGPARRPRALALHRLRQLPAAEARTRRRPCAAARRPSAWPTPTRSTTR